MHLADHTRPYFVYLFLIQGTSQAHATHWRALNAFDNRERPSRHLHAIEVERNREQDILERVDKVSRRHVTGVAASCPDNLPLAGVEGMHDDLRFIPSARSARPSCREQYRFTAGLPIILISLCER